MASRPNVLILMSDHTNARAMAPDSQCLTPNIDALAGEGVRFANFYTTNAICSPARASLMTGTYASTHGMWDCTHTQRSEWVDVSEELTYFSQNLAEAGYAMGYFGKWHVEQTKDLDPFGWQEWDTSCGSARPDAIPGTDVTVETPGYRPHRLCAVGEDVPDATHPAYDRGIDFIRRHAGGDRPFCCFVSSSEPHDPYVPYRKFWEMYDPDEVELSPTLHEEYGLGDKPEVLQRMRAVWQGLSDEQWQRVTAAYWAVISFLDAEVGRIVDALKEAGAWEDTIIVITSDHGDMMGAHGLVTKGVGTGYEEVYNVPLIVRVPGMRSGEDDAYRMDMTSVAPTILDLCGADPMETAQGRSFRGALDGTADPADWQDAYAEFYGQRFVYTQRLTWHGDWKYVFSPGGVDELYNLAADPHEVNNLAADPEHREVLEDMCKLMWRKMKEIGDDSLFRSHYATLRTAPVGPAAIEDQ
jgi:arylsulfatase A-like enzyme